MASTATDDQSKQAPNPHPPPPTVSNSYSNNHPPYPPTNTPYPFAAPPPTTYYSYAQNYHPVYRESNPSLTFIRLILTIMSILLIGAFALSVLTRLIFGSLTPQFSIESLSVPSFNVSDSRLTATWDVNVTVKNSNDKNDVFFNRLDGVIVYEDVILGSADADPFVVLAKREAVFQMKVTTAAYVEGESSDGSYHALVENRRRGTVRFGWRMVAAAMVRSTLWRRQLSLRVFCQDLVVKFDGPVGPGKLEEGKDGMQKTCVVYF